MKQLAHKQGDTLSHICTWIDSNGAAIPLSGYTITAKVKVIAGTLFEDTLSVTVLDSASGTFIISATAAATALWPITKGQYGRLFCDIQFSNSGVVSSSETFEIFVFQEITQ